MFELCKSSRQCMCVAASSSNNVGGAEWVWCTFMLAIDAVFGKVDLRRLHSNFAVFM